MNNEIQKIRERMEAAHDRGQATIFDEIKSQIIKDPDMLSKTDDWSVEEKANYLEAIREVYEDPDVLLDMITAAYAVIVTRFDDDDIAYLEGCYNDISDAKTAIEEFFDSKNLDDFQDGVEWAIVKQYYIEQGEVPSYVHDKWEKGLLERGAITEDDLAQIEAIRDELEDARAVLYGGSAKELYRDIDVRKNFEAGFDPAAYKVQGVLDMVSAVEGKAIDVPSDFLQSVEEKLEASGILDKMQESGMSQDEIDHFVENYAKFIVQMQVSVLDNLNQQEMEVVQNTLDSFDMGAGDISAFTDTPSVEQPQAASPNVQYTQGFNV